MRPGWHLNLLCQLWQLRLWLWLWQLGVWLEEANSWEKGTESQHDAQKPWTKGIDINCNSNDNDADRILFTTAFGSQPHTACIPSQQRFGIFNAIICHICHIWSSTQPTQSFVTVSAIWKVGHSGPVVLVHNPPRHFFPLPANVYREPNYNWAPRKRKREGVKAIFAINPFLTSWSLKVKGELTKQVGYF